MDPSSQIYITAEAIVGLLSFIGNLLVLVAIFRNRQLQTPTNCFIASLATADMLVGLVVAPLAAVSFVGWPDNFLGCTFTNSVVIAFTQVSIFNLLAVAIERFFAIKHPFSYQKNMTVKRAIGVNVMVWCIGLLFGFLPVFGWNLSDERTDDWSCNFVTVIDMEYVVYFHFFGCIVVPLFIIMAIYFYIFLIVRRQMKQIAALEISSPDQPTSSSSKFRKEIKAAKSLAIVIVLFAISWIPIHVLNSMSLLCGANCPYPYQLLLVTIVLSHANSAMNPFLYAYGNSLFKSAFKKMFCRNFVDDNNSTYIPNSRSVVHKQENGLGDLYNNHKTTEGEGQTNLHRNIQIATECDGGHANPVADEPIFNGSTRSSSANSSTCSNSSSSKNGKMNIYTVDNNSVPIENVS